MATVAIEREKVKMKKFILAVILFLIALSFFYSDPLIVGEIAAQVEKTISCEEMKKVLDSEKCPAWAIEEERQIWCGKTFEELVYFTEGEQRDTVRLYRNRPPDYLLSQTYASCYGDEESQKENEENLQNINVGTEDSDMICDKAADGTCIPGTQRSVSPDGDSQEKESVPAEKEPIGVSAKDFKALARMHNELQKAQAELEKIKVNNDPRWEAKKDFVGKIDEEIEVATLDKVEEILEREKDASSIALDVKDFSNFYKTGKFDAYGGVSLIADVGNGVATFTDLVNKGVSLEDATTKTIIDTAGTSAFCLFPPLKAADMVATIPDKFLNSFGIPKDNLVRKATGFLADNSPSAFVELTTDTMIKTQNWSNVGGAFKIAVEDIRNAEGFTETIKESVNLVGTAIGAVPVAVALRAKDTVSATFSAGGKIVNYISSWFTYPE